MTDIQCVPRESAVCGEGYALRRRRLFNGSLPEETLHCPPLHLTTSSILEQLRRLDMSKASGSFLITNRLLKIAGTTIMCPLSRLFNLMISKRQYPTAWKQAEVVPVPKKGSSTFRPILNVDGHLLT
ncbi:hypothetical protein RvY_03794 [Ramazzottius varieornatus]|uniref:Uncharacterized protein n=1 Tax=Ramazzottius varieornatus TaxID=947166 RepID=A0A1D1UPB2_RAMVA|nr:hypothetical protein RvY_03794 [Ramazzottius varieornatus]